MFDDAARVSSLARGRALPERWLRGCRLVLLKVAELM
jgi:hypothetical protein